MRLNRERPKKGQSAWQRLDSMSESLREKNARADPDAQPATDRELRMAKRAPSVNDMRAKLGMTQQQFANAFDLSLATVRDWEQGRNRPDQSARALLRIIAAIPDRVMAALGGWRSRPRKRTAR